MLTFLGIFIAFSVLVTIYATVRTIQLRRNLLKMLADGKPLFLDSSFDTAAGDMISPPTLTLDSIANLEKSLASLDMVVVFAHTIDRPRDRLRDAVEANLARGVRYRFLVSPSSLKDKASIFLSDFLTSAQYVREVHGIQTSVEEMVSLESLASEWDDVPYIFYRLKSSGVDDARSTLVFRGESRNSGLASTYHFVPPAIAHTVKRFLMSQESSSLKIALKDFERDSFRELEESGRRVLEFSNRVRQQ